MKKINPIAMMLLLSITVFPEVVRSVPMKEQAKNLDDFRLVETEKKNLASKTSEYLFWLSSINFGADEREFLSKRKEFSGLLKKIFEIVTKGEKKEAVAMLHRVEQAKKMTSKKVSGEAKNNASLEIEILEKFEKVLSSCIADKKFEKYLLWLEDDFGLSYEEIELVLKNGELNTTMAAIFDFFAKNDWHSIKKSSLKLQEKLQQINTNLLQFISATPSKEFMEEVNLLETITEKIQQLIEEQKKLSQLPKIFSWIPKISRATIRGFAETADSFARSSSITVKVIIFPIKMVFKTIKLTVETWISAYRIVKNLCVSRFRSFKSSIENMINFVRKCFGLGPIGERRPAPAPGAGVIVAAAAAGHPVISALGIAASYCLIPATGIFGPPFFNKFFGSGKFTSPSYEWFKTGIKLYPSISAFKNSITNCVTIYFGIFTSVLNNIFLKIPVRARFGANSIPDFCKVIIDFFTDRVRSVSGIGIILADDSLPSKKRIGQAFYKFCDLFLGSGFSDWMMNGDGLSEIEKFKGNHRALVEAISSKTSWIQSAAFAVKDLAVWTYYAAGRTLTYVLEKPFDLIDKLPWIKKEQVYNRSLWSKTSDSVGWLFGTPKTN